MMPGVKTFMLQIRDSGGEWVTNRTGSPREVRSAMVREAGKMTHLGDWFVVGLNRGSITVQRYDDPERRTTFRMRIVR